MCIRDRASAASSAAAPAEPPPPSTDSNLVVMLPLANQDGAKDGHVLMMPVQMAYATMSQLLGDATSTTALMFLVYCSMALCGSYVCVKEAFLLDWDGPLCSNSISFEDLKCLACSPST